MIDKNCRSAMILCRHLCKKCPHPRRGCSSPCAKNPHWIFTTSSRSCVRSKTSHTEHHSIPCTDGSCSAGRIRPDSVRQPQGVIEYRSRRVPRCLSHIHMAGLGAYVSYAHLCQHHGKRNDGSRRRRTASNPGRCGPCPEGVPFPC